MHSAKGSKNSRKMHRNVVPLSYPYPAQRRPFTANLVRLWGTMRNYLKEPSTTGTNLDENFLDERLDRSDEHSLVSVSPVSGVEVILFPVKLPHGVRCNVVEEPNEFVSSNVFHKTSLFVSYVYNITLFEPLVKYIRKLFLSFFMTECSGKTCEGSVVGCATGAGRVMW